MSIKKRLLAAYRVLQPERNTRFLAGWFHAELRRLNVHYTQRSIYNWFNDIGPVPEEVLGAVKVIEADAEVEALRQLEAAQARAAGLRRDHG